MSEEERSSSSHSVGAAAAAQPKSAVQPKSKVGRPKPSTTRSGESTLSPDSGYTITNTQGVKLTRHPHAVPDDELSPAVSDLPRDVASDCARFWHKWVGASFKDKVSSRGSGGDNACNWVFGTFVTSYCDKFYSQLTPEERCEYESIIGQKIYQQMYNWTKRSSIPKADSDDEDKGANPSRVFGADFWAKEKPEQHRKMVGKHFDDNPDIERTPGQRRAATFKVYAQLTVAERNRYQKMADDEMDRVRKEVRLEGEAVDRFVKRYPKNVKKLITHAESCVEAQALVVLVTKHGSEAKRNITVISSEGLRVFRKDASTLKLIESLKVHVKQTSNNTTKPANGPPRPCIYPDRKQNNRPSVPSLAGLRAADLQDIHREYWKQLNAYTGGEGRFPWEEISKDPSYWLGGKLPGDWKDPGSHDRRGNFGWLVCLFDCQAENVPPSDIVYLRRVLTPNPIAPSESEEVSRKLVTHQGREVWELMFDRPVTKCHAQKDLNWADESLLYADYMRTGPMSGSYSNPLHLPIFPETRTHQVLIDGELREEIVSQANQLPSDVKDEVLELIDKYNEFASHLPAETELGAWAGHAVPLLFSVKRPTQVPTANFFLRCYLPLSYYLSIIQAQKEGTLPYFEMWIDIIFARDLLYHGPSSTLLGGVTGCIWAVLGVVLILFNIAYVRGDAKPLFSPPEAYDTTRLPSSEWDRVRQWCRKLTEALIRSTQTLSPTSPYRLKGVQPTAPAPSDVDLTPEDNLRLTTPLETAPAQTSTTSRELTKRVGRRKSNGKGLKQKNSRQAQTTPTDSEEPGEFTDKDSDSTDFEGKDQSDEDRSEGESDFGLKEGRLERGDDEYNELIVRNRSWAFDPEACPWGRFPNPEVHIDLPTHITKEALLPAMKSAYDELTAALQEWYQSTLMAENIHVERSYGVSEKANPVLSNPHLGPTFATLLTREFVWNTHKAQGEALYPVLSRLKLASSSALQLTLAAVELVKSTEPLGDDEPALGDLNNLGIRLRAKMVEARWIYDDMMDYAHLATRMSREMDWFPDPSRRPAPDSPDIRKCAIWCMKWAKATEELEDLMLAFRRKYWRITGRPFETNFGKPSQYKFGNAIKEEWHQALEACLALGPAPTLNSAPDATAPTPNSVSAPNNPSPTTSAIPPGETATDIPTPVAASSPPVSNSNLPIVDTRAQTKDGQTTDAMEVESSTHAPGKGPDMSGEPAVTTDPAISAPVPAAGHTASKQGRKSGPKKSILQPEVQQAAVAEPRRTRADSKRKVEETQRVTRNTRRKN